MKRVYYNGHRETLHDCQPASNLRAGVCYEVESEIILFDQVNYILRNVENHIEDREHAGYNSCWFKVVPVHQAVVNDIPKIGERLEGFLQLSNKLEWEKIAHSSKILDVHQLSENIYEVYTLYKTYIVQVK